VPAMIAAALAGILWVLVESRKSIEKWVPSSIGFGLGLVLPVSYDFAFFVGGFLMWIVFGDRLKVSDLTLTTIAVGCIVAEGLSGVLKPVLQIAGIIPQ
jgi:uncharacterized oligopeptide transporter (OPT) family protein